MANSRPASLPPDWVKIGRGRSGTVYRVTTDAGAEAVKVFNVGGAAGAVLWMLTGAPNPYAWNRDALRCAYLRRRIMVDLVELWFGPRLRVAPTTGLGHNEDFDCQELRAEFVQGRPASLHHPFSGARDDEVAELRNDVLRPLQQHLREAGFDGLLWQAGYGNPVAASNFLLQEKPDGRRTWVWIDLESGVPALFPLDVRKLVSFYLPRAWAHRAPLFDDVDVTRLRHYLATCQDELSALLGTDRAAALNKEVTALEWHQLAWRSLRRHERAIDFQVASRQIDEPTAAWYRRRPLRWNAREASRLAVAAMRRTPDLVVGAARLVAALPLVGVARAALRFCTSQRWRAALARRYTRGRIRGWQRRGQLTVTEASRLARLLRRCDDADYLTDFGVHLAMKPFYKVAVWLGAPAAAQLGILPLLWVPAVIALGGPLSRTSYTLVRMATSWARRRPRPWVALVVGAFPVVGSAAYPLQLLASAQARGGDAALAGFVVYDTCTRPGTHLPIWGGPDTLVEHASNRLGDPLVRRREPLPAPREAVPGELAASAAGSGPAEAPRKYSEAA